MSGASLAAKLQLKPGDALRVIGRPTRLTLDLPTSRAASAGLLVFATNRAALDSHATVLSEAAKADRLTWVAYPKAGRLGTDLNRDRVHEAAVALGIQPVRQIAIDDDWSALRLRPA